VYLFLISSGFTHGRYTGIQCIKKKKQESVLKTNSKHLIIIIFIELNRCESGGLNVTERHDDRRIIVAPDQRRGYNDIIIGS